MVALPPLSGMSVVSVPKAMGFRDDGAAPSRAVPPPTPTQAVVDSPVINSVTNPKVTEAHKSPEYYYDSLNGQMVMAFLNAKSGAPELQIPDSATLRERARSIASYRPAEPEPK